MTSVVLVDDHQLIRDGLARAFERDGSFEICAQASTLAEAMALTRATTPDVVVTDIQLPDGSGLDLVRSLRGDSRDIGLVVLTMYSGDEQIFGAMEAGASAFVGKDAPATDVVAAAKHAKVSPTSFACAGLAEAMTRRLSSSAPRLSERENEVLQLLADGHGISQIAGILYVSQSTAKTHIARIYEKLGASNRSQALVTAMRMGLVSNSADDR